MIEIPVQVQTPLWRKLWWRYVAGQRGMRLIVMLISFGIPLGLLIGLPMLANLDILDARIAGTLIGILIPILLFNLFITFFRME